MKSLKERFEEKFVPDPNTGCWLWTGATNKTGYGSIRMTGNRTASPLKAHRVSYQIYNGEIPAGMCVCHKCDVPLCVNPKHLFLGTNQDNMNDKVKKNRAWRPIGEKNVKAKLTLEKVKKIRDSFNGSTQSRFELAKKFGVHKTVIDKILRNALWK